MSIKDYVVSLTPRNYTRWSREFLDYATSFGELSFLLEDCQEEEAELAMTPINDIEPKSCLDESQNISLTQMAFNNLSPKEKLLLSQLRGDIFKTLSPESKARLEIREEWPKARRNIFVLWHLIKNTHQGQENPDFYWEKLYHIRQKNFSSLEKFIQEFERLCSAINHIDPNSMSDGEKFRHFRRALDPSFQPQFETWVVNQNYPTTYNELKDRILDIQNVRDQALLEERLERNSLERNQKLSKQPNHKTKMIMRVDESINKRMDTRPERESTNLNSSYQRSSPRPPNPRFDPKIRKPCEYCGKGFHFASQCGQRIKDLEEKLAKEVKKNATVNFLTGSKTFILDTGATTSVCKDCSILHDVEDTDTGILGINNQAIPITKKGSIGKIDNILVFEDATSQVLSFGQLVDAGHQPRYDPDKDTFTIQVDDEVIAFPRQEGTNLYAGNLSIDINKNSLVLPVATDNQFKKLEEMNRLHRVWGHPGVKAMELMLSKIKNDNGEPKFNTQDLNNYRQKSRTCPVCIQSKLTEEPSTSFDHHPSAETGEILHCDIVYHGLDKRKKLFLVGVDHKSGYISIAPLNNKSGREVFISLESFVLRFKSKGHEVKKIYFDHDSSIISQESKIQQMGIELMIRSPYRHEKHVERYVRSLKTIARSMLLNANKSEAEMIQEDFWIDQSIIQAARLHNMLPNTRSPESPRKVAMNLETRERDHKFIFGEEGWTKLHNVPNDISPRSERAIFIGCPEDALGYLLYLPDSKVVRVRHDFTPGAHNIKNSVLAIQDSPDVESFNEEKRKAIEKECISFLDKEVFDFVTADSVDQMKLVNSFMFGKRKINPDGTPGKYKVRVVARGDQQLPNTFDHVKAHTIDKKNLFIALSLAKKRNWNIATADVPSAYLHAPIDQDIYMKLDPESRRFYIDRDEKLRSLTDQKGNLYVKLKRSLYGLKQSGRLWQHHLGSSLEEAGLKQCITEPCAYYCQEALALFHVDDLIVMYSN